MKVLSLAPLAALAFLIAVPATAGHRHGRECGHVYSRPHGGWISIDVFGRFGGFRYRSQRSPYGYRDDHNDRYYRRYSDPYGSPYGYGGYGRYGHPLTWKEFKRRQKYYKKRYKKTRHYGHHDYGPFCPRH